MYFNYDKVPEFADKRARQALACAIDRNENGTVGEGKSGKGVMFIAGISDGLGADLDLGRGPGQAQQVRAQHREASPSLLKAAGWKK